MLNKKNLKAIIILALICLFVGLALAGVNELTHETIASRQEQAKFDSLRAVLGDYKDCEIKETDKPDTADKSVDDIFKVYDKGSLVATVVTLTVKGYAADISMTVGVKTDGVVLGVKITDENETHGQPDSAIQNYTDSFSGKDKEGAETVDHVSKATGTSSAIRKGIIIAIDTASGIPVEEPSAEAVLRECLGVGYEDKTIKEESIPEGANAAVIAYYGVYDGEDSVANIVTLTVQGYKGPITLNVGVKDGAVLKVVVTEESETPGKVDEGFVGGFAGLDKTGAESIELVSQATVTSTAIRGAVVIAIETATGEFAPETEEELPRGEEELLFEATDLLPGATGFEKLELDSYDGKLVKRIFKEKSGLGAVSYVCTYAQYGGGLESETLIATDNNGKIVAIKNLFWKVGHTVEQGAPDEAAIKAFFAGFVGKSKADVDSAELVSGATGTARNVQTAIKDALGLVPTGVRSDAELIGEAKALLSGATEFEVMDLSSYEGKLVKKIFKEISGLGAVSYVCTYAQYGGGLESETLIATDNNGKIVAIKNLFWKVGHTVEQGAPDEAAIKAFFAGFVGKSKADVDSAELVSGATGTARNVQTAIKDALGLVPTGVRSDAEIKAVITEISGASSLTALDLSGYEGVLVKKGYSFDGGFAFYVCTYAQYGGGLESETVIVTDGKGKITAIKSLFWKVGHTVEQGAPDEAAIKVFFAGFVGKSLTDIDSAELVSGATGTARNVQTAIKDALGLVPVEDGRIKNAIAELIGGANLTDITPSVYEGKLVKKVYSFENGFAFYVCTYAQYGGGLESETVVVTDGKGKITAIKNLFWKVGHTVEEGAPDTDAINAFFIGLVGKDMNNLSEAELVSGATGTATNVITAISEGLSLIPRDSILNSQETESNLPRIIGISAIIVLVMATVCVAVFTRKRRSSI